MYNVSTDNCTCWLAKSFADLREISKTMEGGFTSLFDRFSGISQQIGNLQLSVDKHHRAPDVSRDELLNWIHATSTHDDYHVALQARVEGTCTWALQRKEIAVWMATDSSSNAAKVLWIHGKPGSGKTIITASLVNELQKSRSSPICYFFCFYSHEAKRSCDQIVRSWVSQLVKSSDIAFQTAKEIYKGKESHMAVHTELWQIFQKTTIQLQECFYVVDGFDECLKEDASERKFSFLDTRALFLRKLDEAIYNSQARVLFVSREDANIREQLRNNCERDGTEPREPLWIEYEITRQDTAEDIDSFSRSILDQRLSSRAAAELKEELALDAAQKSEGMFLWIKLLYGRLSRSNSPTRLRGIISSTPRGLDQAYERDLEMILSLDDDDRQQALTILRWTLFARRPLTVRELCEVLIVEQDFESSGEDLNLEELDGSEDNERSFNCDDLPLNWDDYVEDQILRLCGSLVDIRGGEVQRPIEDQTVHFVHFSAKEYLMRAVPFSDEQRVHSAIAISCLRYLCYEDFFQQHHSSLEEFGEKVERYALLNYAGVHWGLHAYHCRPFPPLLVQWCNRLLDPSASKWLSYSEVVGGRANGSYSNFIRKFRDNYPSPLFYASLWGLVETMTWLHDQGEDIDHHGGLYGCPLGAASAHGHQEAVQLLLAWGADPNRRGGKFGSPLQSAAAMGHEKIVETLLLAGANANEEGGLWNRPIIAASRVSDPKIAEAIIRRLLEAGADAQIRAPNGETAIHGAASVGSAFAIGLLLQNGADVNAVADEGITPLHLASYNGHQKAMQKLIDNGADVKAVEDSGQSALHSVAEQGYDAMVEVLLGHGADVDARTMAGWTPLHCAAHHGKTSVMKVLLRNGAEIDARGVSGMRALHLAASGGHEAAVNFLLSHGAEISLTSVRQRTALHVAASQGSCEVVEILVSHGADIDAVNRDGSTALHEAVSSHHFATVETLLTHNANVDAEDGKGRKPLDLARQTCSGDDQRIVRLLETGASLDEKPTQPENSYSNH